MEQSSAIPATTVAVQRCCEAYFRVLGEHPILPLINPKHCYSDAKIIHQMASQAFRFAMPLCDSWENIPAFMAAVLQGMVLDVFDPVEASRMLYGASVITSRLRPPKPESRPVGRPNKFTPLPSSGNHEDGDQGTASPFRQPSPKMQAKLIEVLKDNGVPVPSRAELRQYPSFASALYQLGAAYMYLETEKKLNPLPPEPPEAGDQKTEPLPAAA